MKRLRYVWQRVVVPNTLHPLVSRGRCTPIALGPCSASRRRQSPTASPTNPRTRSLYYYATSTTILPYRWQRPLLCLSRPSHTRHHQCRWRFFPLVFFFFLPAQIPKSLLPTHRHIAVTTIHVTLPPQLPSTH